MAGTRSSSRLASNSADSAATTEAEATGTKRKAQDESPQTKKRDRPAKNQKTLEESLPDAKAEANGETRAEKQEASQDESAASKESEGNDNASSQVKPEDDDSTARAQSEVNDDKPSQPDNKPAQDDKEPPSKANSTSKSENGAVEDDAKREAAQPSNILEKGIIYFFTRGRVDVDSPEGVQDLARTYFVLRPIPAGAKLTDGAIQDLGNSRLLELPKKVFPKSPSDRFMAFVGKGKTSIKELRDSFISSNDYETKTAGSRHSPAATPIGEGVYAITHTGGGRGTAHLVYMLTIPSEPSDVQKDLGLAEKGSFVMSIKNPESKGPANAQLPQSAKFPKEMIDEFEGRGWGTTEPKHLDYENAQILLIGESFDESKSLEANSKDQSDDSKETPREELEKLEHEDELRVEHMQGDDTIFADLALSRKEYPSVLTTWPSS